MITLKGAEVSARLKEQVQEMVKDLHGRIPKLAIVRVGERPDDLSYERGAVKKMETVGVEHFPRLPPAGDVLAGLRHA